MSKEKFTIITLGCPKNLVDSEVMAGVLEKNGFTFVENIENSDFVIINTCGFITPASLESIETILEICEHKKRYGFKVIVTGCLSERYKEELIKELKEVDLFTGVNDIENIVEILKNKKNQFSSNPYIYSHNSPRKDISPPHIKYVKIGEGCSHSCAFCVIPEIKGKYRSRAIEDIYEEVKESVINGKKEIILISQDCGYYGMDLYGKTYLNELLLKLDKIEGNFWLRVLYINPQYFSKKLVMTFKNSKHITPYFDIPFQHASKKIIKLMKRSGDENTFLKIISTIRENIPDATIRSTFIVGFPGETQEDFDTLKDFLEKGKLEFVGFFKYYDEEGSESFKLNNKVDGRTADKRIRELEKIQKKVMKEIYFKKYKNKTFKVLIDGYSRENELLIEGRTWCQAPEIDNTIFLTKGNLDKLKIGEFFEVKIKRYLYPDMEGFVI